MIGSELAEVCQQSHMSVTGCNICQHWFRVLSVIGNKGVMGHNMLSDSVYKTLNFVCIQNV